VTVVFFLAEGTEAELSVICHSRFHELHAEPYRVLLDRTGLLDGAAFPLCEADPAEQQETLRRQLFWFWHDLSHFIAAMGRGQLWWAAGQLEVLRRYCVVLARLREDFAAEPEEYDKIDLAVRADQLSPLRATFVPMQPGPMLEAGRAIVAFFRELAPPLAQGHGLTYPTELDGLMLVRLAALRSSRS
jgi:hypothetical protein